MFATEYSLHVLIAKC